MQEQNYSSSQNQKEQLPTIPSGIQFGNTLNSNQNLQSGSSPVARTTSKDNKNFGSIMSQTGSRKKGNNGDLVYKNLSMSKEEKILTQKFTNNFDNYLTTSLAKNQKNNFNLSMKSIQNYGSNHRQQSTKGRNEYGYSRNYTNVKGFKEIIKELPNAISKLNVVAMKGTPQWQTMIQMNQGDLMNRSFNQQTNNSLNGDIINQNKKYGINSIYETSIERKKKHMLQQENKFKLDNELQQRIQNLKITEQKKDLAIKKLIKRDLDNKQDTIQTWKAKFQETVNKKKMLDKELQRKLAQKNQTLIDRLGLATSVSFDFPIKKLRKTSTKIDLVAKHPEEDNTFLTEAQELNHKEEITQIVQNLPVRHMSQAKLQTNNSTKSPIRRFEESYSQWNKKLINIEKKIVVARNTREAQLSEKMISEAKIKQAEDVRLRLEELAQKKQLDKMIKVIPKHIKIDEQVRKAKRLLRDQRAEYSQTQRAKQRASKQQVLEINNQFEQKRKQYNQKMKVLENRLFEKGTNKDEERQHFIDERESRSEEQKLNLQRVNRHQSAYKVHLVRSLLKKEQQAENVKRGIISGMSFTKIPLK